MVFGRQKIGEKESGEVAEWFKAPRAKKNCYLLKLFIKISWLFGRTIQFELDNYNRTTNYYLLGYLPHYNCSQAK